MTIIIASFLGNFFIIIIIIIVFSYFAGVEYVKVILQHGRMVGAILIGDTDLEARRPSISVHVHVHSYVL